MSDGKGVLVCVDAVGGDLVGNALEVIGCGRRLADALGEDCTCMLLGDVVGEAAAKAGTCGADTVLVAEDGVMRNLPAQVCVDLIGQTLEVRPAKIVLFCQHLSDVAARLAFRLGVGMSSNCIGLEVDGQTGRLLQVRPICGAKAHLTVVSKSFPQIATLQNKAMMPPAPDLSRSAKVVPVPIHVDESALSTRVVEVILDRDTVRLDEATVIVSGGRGVGGPEAFTGPLQDLASALGGVVASSRPPVDSGWISKNRLVGITGEIVAPDLYVAVGISGTTQHMTGCRNAKTIVAVNSDPEASIFEYADYGVVGQFEEVVPALSEQLGRR